MFLWCQNRGQVAQLWVRDDNAIDSRVVNLPRLLLYERQKLKGSMMDTEGRKNLITKKKMCIVEGSVWQASD